MRTKETKLSPFDIMMLAEDLHEGQYDKAGEPYWTAHVVQVGIIAEALGCTEDEVSAAYLHDTVEDGHITLKELEPYVSEYVLKLVDALSIRKGENRNQYFNRIVRAGPGAMRIKLADLLNNTRHDRLDKLEPKIKARLQEKYQQDIRRITKELGLVPYYA